MNTGIGFDEDDDLVLVPDQPNFVFSEGFTVAAWVKPVALGGVRTIFRKRQEGTSTFVLVENGQNFQIVISLANGKAADVQAKATLDKFTHVAATYDGIFLKLYLDGQEAASKRVVGRLSDGVGPLLMGNDANKRRIDGVIDNVVFDTLAVVGRRHREADVPPAALGDERDAGRSRGRAAGNARQLRRGDHEQLVRGRVRSTSTRSRSTSTPTSA